MYVGFSIFDSISFWLKFTILFNKMHGLVDIIIPFKSKIIEKPHNSFAPKPLCNYVATSFEIQHSMIISLISPLVGAP